MEKSRLTRDGTAEPVSRDQILRHERGQGNIHFPVQLTTCRIVNLTRLIHTFAICVTIHAVLARLKHVVFFSISSHRGVQLRHHVKQRKRPVLVKFQQVRKPLGKPGGRHDGLLGGVQSVPAGIHQELEAHVEREKGQRRHIKERPLGEQVGYLGVADKEHRHRGEDAVDLLRMEKGGRG